MYFETENCPDKIISEFPIFSSKEDCILHFYSLDLVKRNAFDFALYSLYPESLDKLLEQSFDNNIDAGVILPYRKSKPMIIHIPCCYESDSDFDFDMVVLGIDKLVYAIKELKKLSSIKNIALVKDTVIPEVIRYIESHDLKVKFY
jgi:hypothetical protein